MADCRPDEGQAQSPQDVPKMPATPPPSISRLLKRSPVRDTEEDKALASSRRESFLQDRRDRLAQRREQHDRVLARGRVDVSAKLEALRESLSAAQAARSAIYARIAANGSREMTRVHLVVEHNKQKLMLEREAKRLALEVKQAEAEKRRELALRGRVLGRRSASPRAFSSDSECMECDADRVSGTTPLQAATQIQRFWRATTARLRVKKFLALHLDYDTVGEIPFEVITDVIKTRPVIDCVRRLMSTLRLVDDTPAQKREALCRTMLATFMIVGHPTAILMRQGVLEERLVQHAKQFASMFSKWIKACAQGRICSQAAVQKTWKSFLDTFDLWKEQDSANLVEVMIAQYCELDLIFQIVKMDSDPIVAAEYHTAIKENQLMLLTRIRRIAGDETRSLIRNAVLSARRKRLPRKSKAGAEQEPTPGSPTKATTLDAVKFFALGQRQTRLSNRQLIHELSLDPTYQISKPVVPEEDAVAEAAMKSNFFTSLESEMRAGRSVSWIPIVVQECKMRLLRLVMPDSPTFKAITAAFDIPSIESQCKQSDYDYLSFTNVVMEMMKALCSPARDGLVADISLLRGSDEVELFTKRIDSIFEVLDTLLLDSANFHLSISAARLAPEAIPYEQKKFKEDLESGSTCLVKTTAWLQTRVAADRDARAARDPENVSDPSRSCTLQSSYYAAFAQLCSAERDIPETFHLDHDRLAHFRSSFSRIIKTSSFLMTAQNLMRPALRSLNPVTWTSLRNRLTILLQSSTSSGTSDSSSELSHIAAEINNHLDLAFTGAEPDRPQRHEMLVNLITNTRSITPIQKLLESRLQTLIVSGLRNPPEALTDTKITSLGFSEAGAEVRRLIVDMKVLADVNWRCYETWYRAISTSPANSVSMDP